MTEITKEEITEIELNGLGYFDHLMKAVKEHLQEEFSNQRIRGTDYANVYVGSINTTLQQAISFALGKQQADTQADLTKAQEDLVREQIVTEQKRQDMMDCEIEKCKAEVVLLGKQAIKLDAEIINLNFQNDLIVQQIEKLKSDIELTNSQIIGQGFINEKLAKDVIKADSEIALIEQQVINLSAELPKIVAETALLGKQGEKLDQDILVAQQQVLKSIQEVELIKQQIVNLQQTIIKQGSEISLTNQKVKTEELQSDLVASQVQRSAQEVILVAAKVITEYAQTRDDPYAEIVDATSIGQGGQIGRKNTLFKRQADGFLRDAEQKAAKIYGDIWNIARSTNNDTPFAEILGAPEVVDSVEVDDDGNPVVDVNGDFVKIPDPFRPGENAKELNAPVGKGFVKLETVFNQMRKGIGIDPTQDRTQGTSPEYYESLDDEIDNTNPVDPQDYTE